MNRQKISNHQFADLLGVSRATVDGWVTKGKYKSNLDNQGKKFLYIDELTDVPEIRAMLSSNWIEEMKTQPNTTFSSAELFAGAGGLLLAWKKQGSNTFFLMSLTNMLAKRLELTDLNGM